MATVFLGLADIFENIHNAGSTCDEPCEIAAIMRDYSDGIADEDNTKRFLAQLQQLRAVLNEFFSLMER